MEHKINPINCRHENKKIVNFEFSPVFGHTTEYECLDCGNKFDSLDGGFVYSYPPKFIKVRGLKLNIEDLEVLARKLEKMNEQNA